MLSKVIQLKMEIVSTRCLQNHMSYLVKMVLMLFKLQKIWHGLFIHLFIIYILSSWLLCYRNYSKCYIWWYNRHGSCHCGVYNLIVVTINGNYLNIEVQTLTKFIKNQRELWEKFTGWGWGVSSDQLELRHNKLPYGTTLQLRPPCKR